MRSCLFLLLFLYYIQVMTYCLDFPHGRRLLPFTRVEPGSSAVFRTLFCRKYVSFGLPMYILYIFFISICKKCANCIKPIRNMIQ